LRNLSRYIVLLALLLCAALPCFAEGGKEGDEAPVRKPIELGPDHLPKYHHGYESGLYSTITAMYYCGTPQEYMKTNFREGRIQVPGFAKPVPIHYIKQSFPAPLVVVMLGGDGEVQGPFGELYPYWYGHAGFNVLTFDNSFTPRYPDYCGRGAVGNFDQDTDAAVAIIDAYVKQSAKDFTRIGVIGMSFGGSQALIMATKAQQGKLPFELAGCLAFSPPVKFLSTAKICDDFFKNYRWKQTMVQLGQEFGNHTPVAEGSPCPFTDDKMKAALGFAFRDQLKSVVDRNDRVYGLTELKLPRPGGGDDRNTYLEGTSLQRYIQLGAANYWMKKGAISDPYALWEIPNLERLVPMLPDYAEAVIAENDPFDYPADIQALKALDGGKHVIVLPNGGHLGMITSEWALVKAHHLFDKTNGPTEAIKQPAQAAPKTEEIKPASTTAQKP